MTDTPPAVSAPVEPTVPRRRGFLPIETNAFDRIFISVVLFVALHLVWMRLVEPAGISLYVATGISLVLGFFVVRNG